MARSGSGVDRPIGIPAQFRPASHVPREKRTRRTLLTMTKGNVVTPATRDQAAHLRGKTRGRCKCRREIYLEDGDICAVCLAEDRKGRTPETRD